MALADLLGTLGNILPALAGPGGFAGPMPGGINEAGASPGNGMIEGMGGLEQALSQNAQLGQQRQRMQRPPGTPSKFLNTLGMIGDALATWRGGQPLYAMRLKQSQEDARAQGVDDALRNYLTDPEGAIAAIMQVDPRTGIQLYQSRQGKVPEEAALLQYAGIDPKSPEGQEIIRRKLMGSGQSDPTFVRELEALGIDPGSEEARELYYGRNSPAGYLLKPRQRGGAPMSGGPRPGQVVGGFRFKGGNPNDQSSWAPAGGATASPSPTFP